MNKFIFLRQFYIKLNFAKLLLFIYLFIIVNSCIKKLDSEHECRFWGVIFNESSPELEYIISQHLDSLRILGFNNPDGWGIGYFVATNQGGNIPVIRRGEPSAPLDPRYPERVAEMLRFIKGSGIAHVRKGSSGPVGGIPDPHPFLRCSKRRNFEFIFAHNGTIPVDHLMALIISINPGYLNINPPDYSPNFLDSDLYAILIAEVIDTYYNLTIEECIKTAIRKLDSIMEMKNEQFNFVMTDGQTLWALNFTDNKDRPLTVYFYPAKDSSDFWIVASQPLDTLNSLWVQIPNQTLVCLKPNSRPNLIPIYDKVNPESVKLDSGFVITPNPFLNLVKIEYTVTKSGMVKIMIYDGAGRLVKTLFNGFQSSNKHTIFWDGKDDLKRNLSSGVYFCNIKTDSETTVLKLVLER
uniref:T9SS type A sorting domain-containing protein n=1 Tax=candidate division WOR-3 bacterium TaxID=2052148 RepID=A0A7C4TEM8_UNCW3